MGGRPTVRQQIDRRPVDVVVLVLQRLFFQTVHEHLEIRLGDAAEEANFYLRAMGATVEPVAP
jgi:hypothetical protein